MAKVLVAEKSRKWKTLLSQALPSPHQLVCWPNGKKISEILKQDSFDIVILDLQIGQEDAFSFLEQLKAATPHIAVIITSETEKAELVVKAIKLGAFDFVTKPYSQERIGLAFEQALQDRSLRSEIDYLRHEQNVIYSFDSIITRSPAMKEVTATLKKFSETDATILVTGETGTGKSFLSGSIHFNSTRKKKPFVKINCTNIPETLLESELFGHEKGAYTGANKTRIGRFEQANGGTVFLDEIGEMSLDLQAKLLRVLDEKSFERVGGNHTIHSDVRIITATNRILEEQVAARKFREDFYYRINVLNVHLPPLRQRRECIGPLAQFLLDKACRSLRKKIDGFSRPVLEMFKAYSWPGNIRQLANTIERAVILEEGHTIEEQNVSLPKPISMHGTAEPKVHTTQHLQEHEKEVILEALEESLWIQKDAAAHLGISPRALNYKIRKLGLTHPRWRKNK